MVTCCDNQCPNGMGWRTSGDVEIFLEVLPVLLWPSHGRLCHPPVSIASQTVTKDPVTEIMTSTLSAVQASFTREAARTSL